MSGSLENRSSLRKLEFPLCSQEALNRLYSCLSEATLRASPKASSSATLSPKETELVLEIIAEFILFTKSKSKRLSSVQELQLMQVITDFFQSKAIDIPLDRATDDPTHHTYFSQFTVLNNLFNFLFMEPTGSSKSDDKLSYRMRVLFKLTSITMGLKNSTMLKCLGSWLHREGPLSDRGLQLCEAVLHEFVLLVPDPVDALKSLPIIAPLLAAHFMTSLCEIYSMDLPLRAKPSATKTYSSTIIQSASCKPNTPPKCVVDLVTCWMGEGGDQLLPAQEENRLLPGMAPALESAACLGTNSTVPLMGLAKWTCLQPIVAKVEGSPDSVTDHETYARLHVGILECLTDAHQKRRLMRNDIVSSKKVVVLVNEIRVALDNCQDEGDNLPAPEDCSPEQECLDRLGQFLNCLFTIKCVHGKTDEVVSTLRHLPENNMISILVNQLRP